MVTSTCSSNRFPGYKNAGGMGSTLFVARRYNNITQSVITRFPGASPDPLNLNSWGMGLKNEV